MNSTSGFRRRRSHSRRLMAFLVFVLVVSTVPLIPAAAWDEPEPPTPIGFLRKDEIFLSPAGEPVTTIAYGTDGRVYTGTALGTIYALTLDEARNVTDVDQIDTIRETPNFNENGTPAPGVTGRLLLGLTVDPSSSPSQPVLYVAHSDPRYVYNSADPSTFLDVNSGTITRLTGPNFDSPSNRLDVITGLPRSRKNHATNGVTFGPDGWLYIAQGGNTDLGAAHDTWGSLPEFYLSAAILRANVHSINSTIDVSNVESAADMTQFQGQFELYATGFRNAYDLVWHSNGNLYANENGANVYQGSTPGPQHGCPNTDAIVPPEQNDALFLVTQGMHGGHPNPARGQCVFRDGTLYSPDLTPDPNYQPPLREYNRGVGEVSMDGIIEYTVGPMAGNLISATFSGTELLVRTILNPDGTATIARMDEYGKFDNPLDLATDDDGVIFIAEYGLSGSPGVSVLIPADVVVPELSVTSINPNIGSVDGGTSVTLTGTLFEPGASVTFDGVSATDVVVSNSTTITATTPPHSIGAVTVTVTNPDNESASLVNGFTYTSGSGGASLVRNNSGGGAYSGSTGVWSADSNFSGGSTFSTNQNISGTADPTLYKSERHGNHSYTFPLDNGSYLVTLKFAEIYWTSPGQRVFDVSINGQTVLDDFDILSETGAFTALDKTFPATVSNGALTIGFTTVTDNAKISAIEIISSGGPDTTPPTVEGTDPADNETGVPLDSSVSVTFSEPMDRAATEAAFTLSPNHTGSFSWNTNSTTMTFTPLAVVGKLMPLTNYTATVATSAVDQSGNPMDAEVTWNFTTEDDADTTAPTVSATNPANGTANVPLDSAVSVTFSEPMDQPATEAAFSLAPSQAGSFSWNPTGTTLTFTPQDDLLEDQTYTSTVGTGTKDLAGNALSAATNWSFTTVSPSSDPPPALTGVSPTSGPTTGGTAVTLTGTNFASGATVTFDGLPATNVVVANSTTITAVSPQHSAATVSIVVTNPDDQTGTLSDAFTYTTGGGGESLVRINAGGGSYAGSTGIWSGDSNFTGGSYYSVDSTIANTPDQQLYRAERFGNFSYAFPLENGDYDVTLKFAEIYWTATGQRIFDVTINGQLVLDDFDILSETNPLTALDKTFPATVTNGTLTIGFSTVMDNAKVSAIEIASAGAGGDTTPPTITATPAGGTYSTEQSVTLTANEPATIYYTTDGSTPTTASAVYSAPIAISETTTLRYFAIDTANNASPVFAQNYVIQPQDTTPPSVSASPDGGTYASAQSVTLSANEPATIYYTTDGSTPTTSSAVYSNPINVTSSMTLKFLAVDTAGNPSSVVTESYVIQAPDTTPPTVSATPAGGAYSSPQSVTLAVNEPATIHYTTNGSTPTTSSPVYGGPIAINTSTTLKFFAVDTAGNPSTVVTETYTIDEPGPAPALSSVTPTSGPTMGGTAVTLTGTNFSNGATVTFGETSATNVVVVNGTTITASTPSHSAGAVNVTVTNPDDQQDTLNSAFTYTSPGGTSLVRINSGGGGYAGSTGIWSGDGNFTGGFTYSTSQNISGTPDVPLYRSERYGTFSYFFPVGNGDYLVTLKFAEIYWTAPGQRVFDVTINGQTVLDDFDILTETSPLTALDKTIPVTVTNGGLTIDFIALQDNAKVSAIEITTNGGGGDTIPPTVTATPAGGTFSSPQSVTLSANEPATIHYTTDGSTPTTGSPVYSSPIAIDTSTTLKFFGVDAADNASAVVTETYNIDEGGDPAPALTGVTPPSGPTDGGTSVTLTGSNFASGASVTFDGLAASDVVVVNGSTITATTPAHDAGSVDVTVTNPDNQADTLNNAFTYADATEEGQWTTMPPLPEPRAEVGVVEAGGKVYVIGGGSPSGLSNDVFVFDPASQTWTEVAPYPGPALDHIGTASVNGTVYIIGGLTSWPSAAVNTVYAYNPSTNTWVRRASLPRDRGAMGIAVLNGLIYAAGGLIDGGTAVGDLTAYNPASNTWTTLAPMPTPRDHLVAEAVNGRLYAIGGRPTTINAPVAANEAYNPATNTWESRAPMPTARGGHGSGVLNGKIVVFGGEGNVGAPDGMFGSTEQYDPASNSWETLEPMITPRHGTNGAVVDNVIYVPAGGTTTGGSSSTIHEAFSFVSNGGTLTQSAASLGFFVFLFGCLYRARRRANR